MGSGWPGNEQPPITQSQTIVKLLLKKKKKNSLNFSFNYRNLQAVIFKTPVFRQRTPRRKKSNNPDFVVRSRQRDKMFLNFINKIRALKSSEFQFTKLWLSY